MYPNYFYQTNLVLNKRQSHHFSYAMGSNLDYSDSSLNRMLIVVTNIPEVNFICQHYLMMWRRYLYQGEISCINLVYSFLFILHLICI